MLEVNKVSKTYHLGAANERMVISNLDFSLAPCETVAIIGPSGSGKSTLLRIISGMLLPTKGQVAYRSESVFSKTEAEMASYRNKELGFIFQDHRLLPQLNLLDNVLLPCLAQSKKITDTQYNRALYLIEKLGLAESKTQFPSQLSGGECQRAAVARALIQKPAIVLADEPTGALDSRTSEKLLRLLLSVREEEHTALVMVTHNLEVAKQMDSVYELMDGKLQRQKVIG